MVLLKTPHLTSMLLSLKTLLMLLKASSDTVAANNLQKLQSSLLPRLFISMELFQIVLSDLMDQLQILTQ